MGEFVLSVLMLSIYAQPFTFPNVPTDSGPVRVIARVGSVSQSTSKQPSPYPHWDEKFNLWVIHSPLSLVTASTHVYNDTGFEAES